MASPSIASAIESEEAFLDLVSSLPKERGWTSEYIIQYQGFWFPSSVFKSLLILQHRFRAEPTDIVLASYPKSGTTWLKALLVAITRGVGKDSPLLTANPHELVPVLESPAVANPADPRPRFSNSLMQTHVPYGSLPESIRVAPAPGCRIVYVLRDPKDVLVSSWHFVRKLRPDGGEAWMTLAEAFERFCRGATPFGPYRDHVLGYWKASVEFPDRFLFLRYEDLKREPCRFTRRLSEFIGHPLDDEAVERVVDFCSFGKLANLEVNKSGTLSAIGFSAPVHNNVFFRQGEVGDSKNHLTKEMMDKIDDITREKFKDFNTSVTKEQ